MSTKRACSIAGCENAVTCRDLCHKHYSRLRRHGDPNHLMNADRTLTLAQRLEYHGWDVTPSGCWEFRGSRRHGYGQVAIPGHRSVVASRVAYMAWIGPIADGLFVCHRCDNPPCINPDHLFLGEHQVNVSDAVSKRRHAHGERTHAAKASEDDVLRIRELYATGRYTQSALGRQFGLCQTAVSAIVRKVNWKLTA